MVHEIDLRTVAPKRIYDLGPGFAGERPDGEALSFTNYYMRIDGEPSLGVCGEIHFSRLWPERWEDELLKMRAGGVNIASTYVFWNHHEEREGEFDFGGRRDLRRFVALCGRCGLRAVVRIGPFCHGECRNGGLPDWLFAKPFDVRGLDGGFLDCARRWYRAVSAQLDGLWYKDGRPIIAAQLDNEYMHSAAPWEQTAGTTALWCPAGADGDEYLLRLLSIAREEGIDAPFYTCTGWGGAATPGEMMPLWGGYAFRPWMFYAGAGEHPATEEYLYRDNHNDAVPKTYNFEPNYPPESRPYLCCEMGGGMFCSYNYRFQLPMQSVDAMANIKLGSGCNMLGYYMYHGGTHPLGRSGQYLNEGQVPKRSYDFQAPLGEFGQVRDSYRRLRALHMLARTFERSLCRMRTALPEGSQDISPTDADALRWAVRLDEHGSGFLFLNNYQDHAAMRPKRDESVLLHLPDGDVAFEGLSLAAGENCALPFNLDIGGVPLRWASAQPLAMLDIDGMPHAFFFAPDGMRPRYVFAEGTRINGDGSDFVARWRGANARFITLSREQSLRFSVLDWGGRQVAVLTDGALIASDGSLRIEHGAPELALCTLPEGALPLPGVARAGREGPFARYVLTQPTADVQPALRQVSPTRYTVEVPRWSGAKDVLLRIDYRGDVGSAFLGGELISDNFHNGAPWDIGLAEFKARLRSEPLVLHIAPLKSGGGVNVESAMAGRREEFASATAAIDRVRALPVYEWRIE